MTDFSYAYFIRILEAVREKYEVRLFAEGIQLSSAAQQLFLRHDVDVSITRALTMAEIEAEHGVRATYMFIPNSRLYDIRKESKMLRRFLDLGHEVALHFDVDDERREKQSGVGDVLDDIEADCQRISDVTGVPVRSLSFHRPMQQFLKGELTICGRINAYAEVLMRCYISDSKGNWRCGDPIDFLKRSNVEIVQLLIHPIWWSKDRIEPADQLERFYLQMTSNMTPEEAQQFDVDLAFTVPGVRRSNSKVLWAQ